MHTDPVRESCLQIQLLIQLSSAQHILYDFEETIALGIIVIHQIYKKVAVSNVINDLPGLGLRVVQFTPLLGPESKGLSLPVIEGERVHNCRLHDLSAREDPPGDGDGLLVLHVGVVEVPGLVDHLKVDPRKPSQNLEQGQHILLAGEELEVGLLVDVPSLLAPAQHLVTAGHAVSTRLGVNCQDPVHVDSLQLLGDDLCLPADVAVIPWGPAHQMTILVVRPGDVVHEHVPDVLLRGEFLAPHVEEVRSWALTGEVEEVVVLQLPEGGRGTVAPAAVGELVPVSGAVHVGLAAVGPEDGPHLLAGAARVRGQPPRQRLLDV